MLAAQPGAPPNDPLPPVRHVAHCPPPDQSARQVSVFLEAEMIPDAFLLTLFVATLAAAFWGVKMLKEEMRLKW